MCCVRLVMSGTAIQRQSLVSQGVCWGIAGFNCKEISVWDRCVCVYICVCIYMLPCELKVIDARCVTRAEPSGHGAAIQHAPVCVQVFIYLHECAHSGLLAWEVTSFLVSVYEGAYVCVCAWLFVLPEVSLPMEPWHCTIYQVCAWLYHLAWTEPPSLQAQILLHVNTNNNWLLVNLARNLN